LSLCLSRSVTVSTASTPESLSFSKACSSVNPSKNLGLYSSHEQTAVYPRVARSSTRCCSIFSRIVLSASRIRPRTTIFLYFLGCTSSAFHELVRCELDSQLEKITRENRNNFKRCFITRKFCCGIFYLTSMLFAEAAFFEVS